MQTVQPASAAELAATLRDAAAAGHAIRVEGNGSKRRAGGPPSGEADLRIRTAGLDQVRIYEPRDLTCSVEAGLPYARFAAMLDRDGYMVPLDPPFAGEATVGGVIAANSSGPRRRLYGTARDLVIGMQFATLEGKLVESGGMVVKNVAGLDMAKLLIGSLGTLAVITVVNFKLIPKPAASCTFVYSFSRVREAIGLRDGLLRGVLQPAAFDLLNPLAAQRLGREGVVAAAQFCANRAVLDRCRRQLPEGEVLEGESEQRFWEAVREFTPAFLAAHARGAVVRLSVPLEGVLQLVESAPGAVLCRGANGVLYIHLEEVGEAPAALALAPEAAVIEYGPEPPAPEGLEYWPRTRSDFPLMQRIKEMFDPRRQLNRGRYYGRF